VFAWSDSDRPEVYSAECMQRTRPPDCDRTFLSPDPVGEVLSSRPLNLHPVWNDGFYLRRGRVAETSQQKTAWTGGCSSTSPLSIRPAAVNVWGGCSRPGCACNFREILLAPTAAATEIFPCVRTQTTTSVQRFAGFSRCLFWRSSLPQIPAPGIHGTSVASPLCSSKCLNGLVTHQEKGPAGALSFRHSAHPNEPRLIL